MIQVYLLQDVPRVGIAGEVVKLTDGFAKNFIFPRKLGVQITEQNASYYAGKTKTVERRKEVVATETSMLAEKIKSMRITIKRKMHDADKLYGAVSQGEIAELLTDKGIKVSKSQVILDKSIKNKGTFEVTIKLSARLQPVFTLVVVPE